MIPWKIVGFDSGGGALPYVGRYHLPSLWPHFFRKILHPLTLFFITVHTQCRPLPLFSIFWRKISNFSRASRAFQKFCQFLVEKGEFSLKFDKIYTEWRHFLGSSHQERPNFFGSYTNDPDFSTKPYTDCLLFLFSGRHIPVTFILECPWG